MSAGVVIREEDWPRIQRAVKFVEGLAAAGFERGAGANNSSPFGGRGGKGFFVKVQKDGGADGTSTSAASWTYTVRTLDASSTLGTSVEVVRPRNAAGKVDYQSGSTGYGVAFWDGNTLKLWDAGERPVLVVKTVACDSSTTSSTLRFDTTAGDFKVNRLQVAVLDTGATEAEAGVGGGADCP